jgi:hypothetical protein
VVGAPRSSAKLSESDENSGFLQRGKLIASIERDSALGFAVNVPGGTQVVDLGTRFTIAVDDAGNSNIRVLQGAVQVKPVSGDPLMLKRGDAVRSARHARTPLRVRRGSEALLAGDVISVAFARSNGSPAVPVARGAAAVGSHGDAWNNFRRPLGSNMAASNPMHLRLVDGDTDSGVRLSLSSGIVSGTIWPTSNLDLFEGELFLNTTGKFGAASSATMTFDGFTPGTTIDLYLYASAGGNNQARRQVAVFQFDENTQSTFDAVGLQAEFVEGENYVCYRLTADEAGTIRGTWSIPPGHTATLFNGLQIVVVSNPRGGLSP